MMAVERHLRCIWTECDMTRDIDRLIRPKRRVGPRVSSGLKMIRGSLCKLPQSPSHVKRRVCSARPDSISRGSGGSNKRVAQNSGRPILKRLSRSFGTFGRKIGPVNISRLRNIQRFKIPCSRYIPRSLNIPRSSKIPRFGNIPRFWNTSRSWNIPRS